MLIRESRIEHDAGIAAKCKRVLYIVLITGLWIWDGKNNVTCVIIPFGDIHKKVLYE